MSLPVAAAKAFSTARAATQKASELAAAIVWRPGARVTHRSVTARCYSPRLVVDDDFDDHRRHSGPPGELRVIRTHSVRDIVLTVARAKCPKEEKRCLGWATKSC
jgi:hypothetical protein